MINNQNCFAVNFGYNGEIPLPTIGLALNVSQDWKLYEFESSYNCFFVFVGGKYVRDMKTIVDKVEEITEQFHGKRPIAMFVLGRSHSFEINNFSSYGTEITKVLNKKLEYSNIHGIPKCHPLFQLIPKHVVHCTHCRSTLYYCSITDNICSDLNT